MKYSVRLLFVWLMLLAIPFQGIASAAMLACAHDAPQGTQQAAHATPHHDAASSPCHETQKMRDGASDLAQDTHDHDGNCSACTVCCMGAAMAPAASLDPPAPSLAKALLVAATGRLAAVDLALPERPPRFPLA
ncbi:hypothetical protein ABIB42_002476 [Massilia sp. UYP32]|uniref:DUF2946 family protein n=1 Tax=Massilia TaxID=149698 RepID=UPI00068585C9|nr:MULTISPECIES: DUF2946 family protein [Massilia]QYG02327.1 DUF2946 family protein [Massilia sp. NP310]